MSKGRATVAQLRKMHPGNQFLRLSAVISVLLIVLAWMTGGFVLSDVFSRRRLDNLARFLGELQPEPFRDGQFEAQALGHWVWSLLKDPPRARPGIAQDGRPTHRTLAGEKICQDCVNTIAVPAPDPKSVSLSGVTVTSTFAVGTVCRTTE